MANKNISLRTLNKGVNMKTNNYFLSLLFPILFFSFNNYSCSDNSISSALENEIKLTYFDRKGQDVYYKGDKIGDKIIVYFNGKVEKYARYFEADDVLINTSYITTSDMQDLDCNASDGKGIS